MAEKCDPVNNRNMSTLMLILSLLFSKMWWQFNYFFIYLFFVSDPKYRNLNKNHNLRLALLHSIKEESVEKIASTLSRSLPSTKSILGLLRVEPETISQFLWPTIHILPSRQKSFKCHTILARVLKWLDLIGSKAFSKEMTYLFVILKLQASTEYRLSINMKSTDYWEIYWTI